MNIKNKGNFIMKALLRKFEFNTANAGWAGALAGAFFAFSPMNEAQAQSGVHPEAPASDIPTARSPDGLGGDYNLIPNTLEKKKLELKDSGSDNILSDYFQFIDVMWKELANGSCCHMQDGVVPLETEYDADNNRYRVTYNQTRSGLRIETPHTEYVKPDTVLSAEHAIKRCEPFVEAAEANGVESTCIPPPFSVYWMADGTSYDEATGKHKINAVGDYPAMLVDSDYIISTEHYEALRARHTAQYCFWPEPTAF